MADGAVQRAHALMAVSRFEDAIREVGAALTSEPQDPDLLCTLALALMKAGRLPQALKASQSAVAAAPQIDWPYRIMAIVLTRQGRGQEAVGAAMAAQRINPESPLVLQALAEAQLTARMTAPAAETASRLIAIAPESADGYDLRGRAAMREKHYADAETDFRRALRLEPDSWVFNNNLGVVLRRQKKKKEAVEAFERAVKANPRSSLARNNLFGSTSAYVGGGTLIVLYIAIRAVPFLARNFSAGWFDALVAGAIILAIAGAWAWRRSRRRHLSTEVDRFYQLEARRKLKVELIYGGFRLGPILAAMLGVLLLITIKSPATGFWFAVAAVFSLSWGLASRRFWNRFVLPRVRPAEASAE